MPPMIRESPVSRGPVAADLEDGQTFRDRMALKQAKQTYGHLPRVTGCPEEGTQVRLICDHQPRGTLAKVNGLRGEVTGKRGRWVEITMCIEGALYTYRATPNNLRLDSSV